VAIKSRDSDIQHQGKSQWDQLFGGALGDAAYSRPKSHICLSLEYIVSKLIRYFNPRPNLSYFRAFVGNIQAGVTAKITTLRSIAVAI